MKTVFLLSCVKRKQPVASPAKDLYASALFKGFLRYVDWAKKFKPLPQPVETYILSAQHGLLDLDTVIEPYDKTLLKMSTVEVKYWADVQVLPQLRQKANLKEDLFIFLAGKRYREFITPEIRHWHAPLSDLGIGKQLKRLKELDDDNGETT